MSGLPRIAIDEAPGETRAAAFDAGGRPVRLFVQRWSGEAGSPRLGDIVRGRLRNASPKDGGGFFELADGTSVFVRGSSGLTDGAETGLVIQAEARRGKLARAALTDEAAPEIAPFDRWLLSVAGDARPEIDADPEAVDSAFDLALQSRVGLVGGGEIEIARTAALTAVDVDTIGRRTKGSAAARAFSVNRDAVAEAARQMALRNLGGLVVIDCVAPIPNGPADELKSIFISTFKAISPRAVEALRPSRFGLLEAKLGWGETPIEDRLLDETGQPTGETELLALLRAAQRDTQADRTGFFSLALSPAARAAYMARRERCDRIVQEAFSGRVRISEEPAETSVVTRL